MRGVLITVEGVEGSGKTTQCRRLAERLRARGLEVVETSEPDGTPLGGAIRKRFEGDGPRPTPLTQAFLFMAARQQHVAQVIGPALARGAVVLSDRYTDATLAYQGYGQGLDLQTIRDLNVLATGGLMPDLTLLLDLDPGTGMSAHRAAGRSMPSSAWISTSIAGCGRAIWRSPGPTSAGCSSSMPPAIRTACTRRSRAEWTRRSAGGSRGMAPERIAPVSLAEGDLFGGLGHQPQAVEHLRHALASGHVAHAYAFVGPPGSGRQAAALAFATALVHTRCGHRRADGGSCGAGRAPRRASPRAHAAREEPQGRARPSRGWCPRARAAGRSASRRGAGEGLHRGRGREDDPRHPAGLPQDAGGAAGPDGDHPHPGPGGARCPPPCSRAARSCASCPRPRRARWPSCPTDGASRGSARWRCSRRSRRAAATPCSRVGKRWAATARRRRRVVETCWLWYRDLLAAQAQSRAAAGLRRARGGGARPRRRALAGRHRAGPVRLPRSVGWPSWAMSRPASPSKSS